MCGFWCPGHGAANHFDRKGRDNDNAQFPDCSLGCSESPNRQLRRHEGGKETCTWKRCLIVLQQSCARVLQTAGQNIELQTTILSRFDLIFIVKDIRSVENDRLIANHVLNVHKSAGEASNGDDDEDKDAKFLRHGQAFGPAPPKTLVHCLILHFVHDRRYVEYARLRYSPRLSEAAARRLQNEYVQFRKQVSCLPASPVDSSVQLLVLTANLSWPAQVRGIESEQDEQGKSKDKIAVPITVRSRAAWVSATLLG